MTSEDTKETLGVQIANQIINIANSRLEDGLPSDDIAAGLRHAAANFSAFAFFRTEDKENDPNAIVDDFINMFTHYLERHQPADQPAQGLHQLVEQAKNEI